MSEKAAFLIRTSFFTRSKLLTITPDQMSIGLSESEGNALRVSKEDIESFRFTARWVRHYVYLYAYYKIDVLSLSGKTTRIRLISIFGLYKRRIGKTYGDILQSLYNNFFSELAEYYINLFSNSIDFDLTGLIFTQAGVKFSNTSEIIRWQDVDTREYLSYFAVFSKKDNYIHKAFNYWDDWNTMVLNVVIRTILTSKN